jgi:hypothetical protein
MRANNAAAKYSHTASGHTRDTAEQYACATFAAAHGLASGFNREATSDFAHGCQQGQGAAIIGHSFIRNSSASAGD